ncbi:SIR2Hypothetical protein, partial [Rhizoctonia solani]
MSSYPGTYIPPLAPAAGPPRRTYGKKRILDPELLNLQETGLMAKKPRTLASLPVNGPKPSPLLKHPQLLSSSPVKPWNAPPDVLDTQTSHTPTTKVITSRHFSLSKDQNHLKVSNPTHQGELRRKTSEATTTVSVPFSDEHSWLVPPPPRVRATRTKYITSGDAEFSFNPPAESTWHQTSPTPRANMHRPGKRHDSILSTDSDEDGDTVGVTKLLSAAPLLPKIKPKPRRSIDLDINNDTTPRAPPLIEQLCRSRSGSLNTTIRPLNLSFRQTNATDADDEMEANRPMMTKNDPAVRALADACASMGLNEPGQSRPPAIHLQNSSPTNRPARRHRKSRSAGHSSAHRLSPGTVHKLSQRPRVGMRIEPKALSPNEDTDIFATYDFDKGIIPGSGVWSEQTVVDPEHGLNLTSTPSPPHISPITNMNGAASANVLIEAVSTQELDDMYQDVDSEEFSEFGSDIDEQEEGEADIPALERLNKEVQATFSDEDIDEMIAYLKEEGMISWIKEYVTERKTPVLILLAALGAPIPLNAQKEPHSDQNMLHRLLKVTLTRILRRRSKLEHINTPEDIVELIKKSKNIIVLTGAGISVSCGIPDFRSSSGIYAQINESNNYELDDPQQMFDIEYFRKKPSVF